MEFYILTFLSFSFPWLGIGNRACIRTEIDGLFLFCAVCNRVRLSQAFKPRKYSNRWKRIHSLDLDKLWFRLRPVHYIICYFLRNVRIESIENGWKAYFYCGKERNGNKKEFKKFFTFYKIAMPFVLVELL